MKRLLSMCTTVVFVFCGHAENKPNASVHLRITSRLPIAPEEGCSGVFTVKNTGDMPFKVLTAKGWSGETTRFYRGGNEEQQQEEDEFRRGKERRKSEREEVASNYDWGIEEYPETVKTLQPNETVSFECNKFYFTVSFSSPYSELYKAEMYLGDDVWVPVEISPPIGYIRHVDLRDAGKDNVFVYAQEGTNQYLYVKTGDEFKRVSEMKLGAKPQKEKEENAVTFELPDGTKKKLTVTEARQLETGN